MSLCWGAPCFVHRCGSCTSAKRCVLRRLLQKSSEANGLAAAGLAAPFVARSSSLEIDAGLSQATLVAAALHIIPPLIPLPTWSNELLTCGLDGFVCWRIRLPMTFASVFLSVLMVSGHNCFGSVLYPVRTHLFVQQPILWSLNWNRCRSQQQTARWQMSRTPCLMDTLQVSQPHEFERLAEQAMKCTRLVFQRT